MTLGAQRIRFQDLLELLCSLCMHSEPLVVQPETHSNVIEIRVHAQQVFQQGIGLVYFPC